MAARVSCIRDGGGELQRDDWLLVLRFPFSAEREGGELLRTVTWWINLVLERIETHIDRFAHSFWSPFRKEGASGLTAKSGIFYSDLQTSASANSVKLTSSPPCLPTHRFAIGGHTMLSLSLSTTGSIPLKKGTCCGLLRQCCYWGWGCRTPLALVGTVLLPARGPTRVRCLIQSLKVH